MIIQELVSSVAVTDKKSSTSQKYRYTRTPGLFSNKVTPDIDSLKNCKELWSWKKIKLLHINDVIV